MYLRQQIAAVVEHCYNVSPIFHEPDVVLNALAESMGGFLNTIEDLSTRMQLEKDVVNIIVGTPEKAKQC